ncbi:soluble n-ethylmaleimide sensitive factor, putative [Leishmania tarentolae]|uniref:Soluble n-ethylmaleimide sensitive factor, putative n=1 Tax=Leishmania tarentolae TaxID=5689 RepID=A0A640KQ60_LEITA|nr:soluble n-ethylmaleimide sensitive factor, putative [Leishmania tarentolae]
MEERGDALMAEAEKQLKKRSWFSSSDMKIDEAHDKLLQAATQYKAAGNFVKVAQAYRRASEMSLKNKNESDQAVEMEEAAKAYVKAGDAKSAAALLRDVVDMYDKAQKYTNAAKACATLGDLTMGDEAMRWLQQAVRYFRNQGAKVSASEIVLKMADMKARSGDYAGAQQIYEHLARDALEDRVARGNARKLFFTALLCQLALTTPESLMEDVDVLQERFQEYQELDTQLNMNTREHMFMTDVIAAIQGEDTVMFDEAVREYDSICPLDDLREKMILKGKQALRKRISDLR